MEPEILAQADPQLVRVLLTNVLSNAWKFTSWKAVASIEFGQTDGEIFAHDDGIGFDMAYAHNLFSPFQRLVAATEFPGLGIGLATAARVVRRHGGKIRAEGRVGRVATIAFRLKAE